MNENANNLPDTELLENRVLNELNTEERYVKFFENYLPYSVERFKKEFASKKAQWYSEGEECIKRNEAEDMQWVNAAFGHFNIIQQKKLFDAQCLWRADKTEFKEITISADFKYWEMDIMNCPLIDPVTEKEADLYVEFLRSSNVILDDWNFERFQDYEGIKEAYATDNANRNFPEWYDFHNGHTGAGVYLTLPDIRGDKEKFYINLANREQRELNREAYKKYEQERDKRPSLMYYKDEFYKWFVETFESSKTRRYFQAWTQRHQYIRHRNDDIHFSIDLLESSTEIFPMEGHYDWRKAIEITTQKFRCHKIAEAFPEAWQQYKIKTDAGLPFEKTNKMDIYNRIRETEADQILRGRELNGDPKDFNFY
jgi:hypothetical protein